MPTLQQMRYLVAVADTLHFRRAAEAQGVTQPTLSAQIKEMERRLGTQLIERSRSRVVMTTVGQSIADRARQILIDVEDIRTIAQQARPLIGILRAGLAASLGSYLLPMIYPDLQARLPELRIFPREGRTLDLTARLEAGALDVLFLPLPIEQSELVAAPLFSEPLYVVMPGDHPLAARTELDPGDLAGQTVLTLERGHKLYDQVERLCDSYGAHLSHDYEATSLDTIRQMVRMGLGLTFLPALYIRAEVDRDRALTHRPIRSAEPARLVGLVWRRGSARDEEFRELARIVSGILATRAPEVDTRGARTRLTALV